MRYWLLQLQHHIPWPGIVCTSLSQLLQASNKPCIANDGVATVLCKTKECMSCLLLGTGPSLTMDILAGSTCMPLALTIWPKNFSSDWTNLHFDSLAYTLCLRSSFNTTWRCIMCSWLRWERWQYPDRLAQTCQWHYSTRHAWCFESGALVFPQHNTLNSNRPKGVVKAVSHTSSAFSLTWLYALCKSILLKTVAPCSLSHSSSVRGSGQRYLIVWSFRPPVAFLTKRKQCHQSWFASLQMTDVWQALKTKWIYIITVTWWQYFSWFQLILFILLYDVYAYISNTLFFFFLFSADLTVTIFYGAESGPGVTLEPSQLVSGPGYFLPVLKPLLSGMRLLKCYNKGTAIFEQMSCSGQSATSPSPMAYHCVHWCAK